MFKIKIRIPPINSTIFNKATAEPPIDVTFLMLSNPREIKTKTRISQATPKSPRTCVLESPNTPH